MKMKKRKDMMLKSVLVGALVFGTSSVTVFADEEAKTNEETKVVTVVTTQVQSEQEAEVEPQSEGKKSPLLVPGDFFYFVKVVYEKIQLSVSSNDFEKAKLLAVFAEERISEANALIQAGKTDLAEKSLEEALTHQLLALELTEATAETELAVEGENTLITATAKEDDIDTEEIEDNEKDKELKAKLGNNIEALLLALGKIDNPKAQEALMNNIEKSFSKMEKRIDKIENKNQHKVNVEAEAETEEKAEAQTEAEATVVTNVEEEEASEETIEGKAPHSTNAQQKGKLQAENQSKAEAKEKKVKSEKKVEIKTGLDIGKEKRND